MKLEKHPQPARWGIEDRAATEVWFPDMGRTIRHCAITVAGEHWVVRINPDRPRDTPVSGPFDTMEGAKVALVLIETTEGT